MDNLHIEVSRTTSDEVKNSEIHAEEEIDPYYKELSEEQLQLGLLGDPHLDYHAMPGPPEHLKSNGYRPDLEPTSAIAGSNSHFEVEGDGDPDGKFNGEEMLDPQTKLQLILRKAFEYRVLNTFEAQFVRSRSEDLTFISLLLSGISSILLLTNYTRWSATIAATLTAAVTTLTGYNSYMQFTTRYEKHTASVRTFASIQRDVMADIQTLDDDEITDKFNEYSAALSSAIANMPLVEQARMDQYRKKSKNADGSSEWETTFPNISDIARWNESVENIQSMKELGMFSQTSNSVILNEKQMKQMGLKSASEGYMRQLARSGKSNEERLYVSMGSTKQTGT